MWLDNEQLNVNALVWMMGGSRLPVSNDLPGRSPRAPPSLSP